MSAASVVRELNKDKYDIIPLGMDKEGLLYRNDYQELLAYKDSLPVSTSRSQQLPGLLNHGRLAIEADVVFPVIHGPLYEDGCLQGILKTAGVAYVGSDVISSAIGMDKDMCRRIVCSEDIACARYEVLSWHSSSADRQKFCQHVMARFGWPMFVKPCALGSSVGIHKVKTLEELQAAIEDALRYDDSILVEEFIKGREIELAVLENSDPKAPPLVSTAGEIRVTHADGFYSYAAKYLDVVGSELEIPAKLEAGLIQSLQKISAEVFSRLKCRGMARVDFFVDDSAPKIYFNEINTLPGFTAISMYPKLWQASGLAYPELLDALINAALTHHHCRQQLLTSYQ